MKTTENVMFQILDDVECLCDGALWHYFGVVYNAPNTNNPYHNFRHLMHVMCQAYIGGKFMKYHELVGKRRFRALMIAAMFHDYAHSGFMGNDKAEVDRSIEEVKKHILPIDLDLISEISTLIRATQFPHVECDQGLGADIIRDADISQLFDEEWIQQNIFGLSMEMNITPLQMLQNQTVFVSSIVFYTQWAKESFLPLISVRLTETKRMLENL